MKIVTEKASKCDVDLVLGFMEDYYRVERLEFQKENSRRAIHYLLEHHDIGTLWIIICDNAAIGFCCLAYNFSLDIGGRDCFLDEI